MRVSVLILNYVNWKDTLCCLESVLRSTLLPEQIVVVDNASPNDSIARIASWADGHEEAGVFNYPGFLGLLSVRKPIKYALLSRSEALSHSCQGISEPLVIISNDVNHGFAAGNNIGLRFLLCRQVDAIWLLNSDTVVDEKALESMRNELDSSFDSGICGCLVRYTHDYDIVQCLAGGTISRFMCLPSLYGNGLSISEARCIDKSTVENEIDYVNGASMMIRRNILEKVGFMDERYFLFYEEVDWAIRAKSIFKLVYAQDAEIFHHEGRSTGWSRRSFNHRALWWLTRSRLLFAAKFYPWRIPFVCISIIYSACKLVGRRLRSLFSLRRQSAGRF